MIIDVGQFQSAFEWIRVTAEYSNAVLVAVMPYVSDVAQKLDLPVPHPLTVEHVVHCSVAAQRAVGMEVEVQGDWVFAFQRGYINTIQGPHDYFTLQDPDKIPAYFGAVRMSKAEVIELGRETIRRLGIPLEAVFAEQEPRLTEPEKIGTNLVPHYRVEWLDPKSAGPACVDMDINADAKRVERIRIFSKSLEKPPPKIDVVPPAHPSSPHWPQTNPEYAWKLIPIALRAVDEYAQTLALSIPRPLTTNHIARFALADNGGWPHAQIELTNGWRFIYRNSMVNGHYAPDDLFTSDNRPIRVKEFAGKWNMTEQEAIDLVKRTLAKFNCPTNTVHVDFKPQVHKPALPGIPRYSIYWWFENETHDDLLSKVEAEVDADKGELKSFYYDDKSYWNKPPPIDVPLSLPTATIPKTTPGKSNGTQMPPKPATKFTPFQPTETSIHK